MEYKDYSNKIRIMREHIIKKPKKLRIIKINGDRVHLVKLDFDSIYMIVEFKLNKKDTIISKTFINIGAIYYMRQKGVVLEMLYDVNEVLL